MNNHFLLERESRKAEREQAERVYMSDDVNTIGQLLGPLNPDRFRSKW